MANVALIRPVDRLGFTLFLSAALHLVLILGINASNQRDKPDAVNLAVTLIRHLNQTPPEKADFLAQANQTGSGLLEEKKRMTAQAEATLPHRQAATPVADAVPAGKPASVTLTPTPQGDRLTRPEAAVPAAPTTGQQLARRALEIAGIEASLDYQRQDYAKRPRIKRLSSLSTAASADAFYLASWRRKIEAIGNLNYPEEARQKKIYGRLRLMVAILPDGSLHDIELLESSGHRVLDDAAIRIVRLAAPFAPFPHQLRGTTDILEIIRTWQFRKNSSLGS